jgi:CelD/BcsL family acetyltransferase involved in cellulose biosynthesis
VNLHFVWLTRLEGKEFPRRAYAHLHASLSQATPFNRLAWLAGAAQALDRGQSLHVLLAWQKQRLVLCLPLIDCRERKLGLPVRIVRHLGYPLSDRLALMLAPDVDVTTLMPLALQAIRKRLPHGLLQLSEISGSAPALGSWATQSWHANAVVSCRAPEHRLVPADREEPGGDVRYKLRRAKKRCAQVAAQVRRITPDAQTIDALLQTMTEVEQASWKGDEGVGIFSGSRRQHWIYSALRGLAAEGAVRCVLLELEGRCISYRLGLLDHGRLYDYNLAFLQAHADLGSGRLLLDEWIHWGLDEGWEWIDASRVSRSRSNHQLHERMSGQVEHLRWSFYSRRPSGALLGQADRLWQWLKPRLKHWRERRTDTPGLESTP